MKKILLPFLCLLLYSCGHHTGAASSGTQSGSIDADAAGTAPPAGDFYKHFTGTIAGKPVTVQLQRYGKDLRGAYQYVGVSRVIDLHSWEDTTQDDELYLTEISPELTSGEQDSLPHWTVSFKDGGLKGTWMSFSGLRTADINLKEEYPDGSYRLDAVGVQDSARLLESKQEPRATAGYTVLQAHGNDAAAAFINTQLDKALNVGPGDLSANLHAALKKYFDSYRQDNLPLIKDGLKDELAWSYNFSQDEALNVLYNDRGWLIIQDIASDYTGGAHGNYGASFLNMDVQGNKVWQINDVITDTAALKTVLNLAARNHFHLGEGADMDQAMLVNEVHATDNFYITPEGISFVYNPYEIASYADGIVQLYIPFHKLMPLLTPAFKARMHLSNNAGAA